MTDPAEPLIRHGTPAFRRTNLAMFASGVATFGMFYCVQPMLPEFSRQFGVGAAASALSLSLPSAVLAVATMFAGSVSDTYGRKPVMTLSLASSAVLMLLAAAAPTWHSFLLLRALLGLTMAGLPSVAMTYLAEEVHPESIGLGMGLYVGGNAAGGMVGRLLAGVVTGFYGWRVGLACVGAIGCIAAWLFVRSLPASRHYRPQPMRFRASLQLFKGLYADPGLPWLFAQGFLLMGSFVTIYNFIAYRLMDPPYDLSQATVGLIFSVYLVGIFSSSWVGHWAGRIGRRKVLWTMLVTMLLGLGFTTLASLGFIVGGIALITFGFFGGHSVVSSWIGRRAGNAQAQASSMYLFVYYMGSSLAGGVGGLFYTRHGWNGVAAFVAVLAGAGLLVSWRLFHLAPLPARPAAARL